MIRSLKIIFCILAFLFIPIISLQANSSQIIAVNASVDYSSNVKLGWSVIVENDVSSVDVTIKYGESENVEITTNYTTSPFNRYSGQNYTISNTELKPETTYYYQIIVDAGINGILKSEIYSFVTRAECSVNFTNSLEGKEFMVGDTVSIYWNETNANSIRFSVMDSIGNSNISYVEIENSGNYKWNIPGDFLDRTSNRFYNIKLDAYCSDSRSSSQTENFRIGTIKDLKLEDENTPVLDTDIKFTYPLKGDNLKIGYTHTVSWSMPERKQKGVVSLWLEGEKLANNNYQLYPIADTLPEFDLHPAINNGQHEWYIQDRYDINNAMALKYYRYELNPAARSISKVIYDAQKIETADVIRYNFPPLVLNPGNYRIFGKIHYSNDVPKSYFYSDYFQISNMDELIEDRIVPEVENNPKTNINSQVDEIISKISIKNRTMHLRLRGKIMLKVEDAGKAYYVHPQKETMHYLGRPDDAFSVMREQGIGITTANLEKIPVGLDNISGPDSDGDGLSDLFEEAIGTDKNKVDTDDDGYRDKVELMNNYSPKGNGALNHDLNFANTHKGKIFLQIEGAGEAWYINPNNGKRYFLGRPADAFNVMRNLGLGISNNDFESL